MSVFARPKTMAVPSVLRKSAVLLGVLLLFFAAVECAHETSWPFTARPLAEPALDFDELFQRNQGGWTGGDGTLSVLLPDGRTVWLFGDTLLGTVSPDQTRPPDTPFIRNCLVVQKQDLLETRYQSIKGAPSAFFTPPMGQRWFWPGDATVEGNQLRLFLHHFEQYEPQLWAWRWTGTTIATLSLPELTWIVTHPAPSSNRILYGAAILETEHYTYIYGIADQDLPKHAHVARTAVNGLIGPWTYFNGQAWSDAPDRSASILSGVSTQYSVIQADRVFYLFTMDGRIPFSNTLVVYRSRDPWGPWQGPQIIYRAPETDQHVVAYNPFVHTQYTSKGRVLVSYNLNHISDPTALYRNADIYRPRFIRVDLARVEQLFR